MTISASSPSRKQRDAGEERQHGNDPAKAEIAYLAKQEKTQRGAGEQWQMLQQGDGRARRLEKNEGKSQALHGYDEGWDDGALCDLRERVRVAPHGQHGARQGGQAPDQAASQAYRGMATRRVFICRSAVCGGSIVDRA
jgi:hypothetical protein